MHSFRLIWAGYFYPKFASLFTVICLLAMYSVIPHVKKTSKLGHMVIVHPVLLIEKLKLHSSDGLGSAFLKGRFFPYVPSRSLRSAVIDPFSVSSRHQIEMERALKEAFLENAQVLPKAFPFKAHQNPSLSVIRKRCKIKTNLFFSKYCYPTWKGQDFIFHYVR